MGTNENAGTSISINQKKHSPDSEWLGFWGNGRWTVGYVDEVNGPEAVEMSGVVATKHELVQLVKCISERDARRTKCSAGGTRARDVEQRHFGS